MIRTRDMPPVVTLSRKELSHIPLAVLEYALMAEIGQILGSRWRVVRTLGRGGQGVVAEVEDARGGPTSAQVTSGIVVALREFERVRGNLQEATNAAEEVSRVIKNILKADNLPRAALKELLPFEDSVNANTALQRMENELDTLSSVSHPALVKVLDSRLDERWFVMEYFKNGPMSRNLNRYKGQVLDALKAARPIVDATSEIHKKGRVHRDIKPDNVFVADDGHLVLGDCGLAIKLENQDRLTMSFENVGTRDYQPPWTYGLRVDDVKPTFDVFGLAKLMWAMVSGRPRFPLEDFDVQPHDLRAMFPGNPDVLFLHRLFKKCIVRRELQCEIGDAAELLDEVDQVVRALEAGGQLPSQSRRMRCRFCGIGHYKKADRFQEAGHLTANANREFYSCNHCGHLESFAWIGKDMPAGWQE